MSIDVSAELRREVRIAAARRDQSLRDFVIEAIAAQLRQDRLAEQERAALHGASYPVLAELWDNPADAVYDQRARRSPAAKAATKRQGKPKRRSASTK